MLGFIIRKLLNKKWMTLSLLIGNLLMIAITAAIPMYSQAVLQRTLTGNLRNYLTENNKNPGIVVVKNGKNMNEIEVFEKFGEAEGLLEKMAEELGNPVEEIVRHYSRSRENAVPDVKVEGQAGSLEIEFGSYSGLEEHIKITYGKMYDNRMQGNTIEVIVNEKTFVEQNLVLNQVLELGNVEDTKGQPYLLKIVGIFESKEEQDPYWIVSPAVKNNVFLMDEALFREMILEHHDTQYLKCDLQYHMVLDYTAMRADQAEEMLQTVERYGESFGALKMKMTPYFQKTLEEFLPEAQKLNTTIIALQVPVFMLLVAFIFMVSGQMLEMEQNEISVFKSRGAGKRQIVGMYLLQSVLVAVTGLVGGIPLGILVCRMIGASNAFLEFVQRTALSVELDLTVWIFALAAMLISIGTMVLPVLRFANVTIVDHKRRKNRKGKRPWWQMVFLDVILLGIAFYGLYHFRSLEEFLAGQVLDGASLDPTLYLSSSLFMLGSALLVLRLLPMVIRLIFKIGEKWWSPAVYASFLRITRTNDNQGFLVVFLILTVSLGIFDTQAARTINRNAEERIHYSIGADVVLQEIWETSGPIDGGTVRAGDTITYREPDFGKYEEMEGLDRATKVLVRDDIIVTLEGGNLKDVMLMGIHTKEFGQIAWFKESLLSTHWYHYLNAISRNSGAVLVSSNFREQYGYEVGDTVSYRTEDGNSERGVIYGFVDYWPSYAPVIRSKTSDGTHQEREQFLIVANMSQLQSSWGVLPYQVWIDAEDSSRFLYDYAEEQELKFSVFEDASAELIALKNDPVFQGTNGILTIGFIVVLLLCATGFLIYWILSIQSRTLQFGIFRAMGMSGREILAMLCIEQFFVSGISIVSGVFVGKMCASLFVPLIQIAYSSADQVIPLEIISELGDYLRLGIVIGAMIVLCMVILGVLISRIRIAQALKLGED